MPPRKAAGSVPPSSKSRVPVPPVQFEAKEENARSSQLARLQKSAKTAKRRSFSDLLTYLFIRFLGVYFIIGALFTCSTHPFSFDYSTKDPNSMCRNLAYGQKHIVPVVAPLFRSAHQRIDPYTGPYIKAVKPYTQTAWKSAKPYYNHAQKQGKVVYNKHVEPMRKNVIKRGRSYSDPQVKKFNTQYQKQVQPHVDNLNKAVKPYQDIYDRDVAPYFSQAYSQSLALGSTSYNVYINKVHPQIIKNLQQLHSFYTNHLDPAVRRAYSLYVRPQVEKLTAKLYERKAHATSSEAISEAKQEVKEAVKEGKARSEQAQDEAVIEATRKKNDPSVVEKAQQATESFLGMVDDAQDQIEAARLEAELAAELQSAKEQLEAWEDGMSKLMGKEYKLFTERISDLRNRRLADLPDHFDSLTETSVEDEVAAILARLERMYKNLGKSDLTVSEQVAKANQQYDAQKAKLAQSEESLQEEIAQYQKQLSTEEAKSLDASVHEVRRYVVEAGRSYADIMDEAKFETTVDDFEGWDAKMIQQANSIEQDMRSILEGGKIRTGYGAVDLRKEPKLDSHIADLQSRVKKLYSTASSQVDSYVTKGNMQLRGEGALGAISDATDAVATQAKLLSEGAAALMLDSALAARKKVGLGPKESAGILERVQQGVHQATRSVASVVGATPTASSAGEYIDDYASSASSLAASVVGYKTEPDSYLDSIKDSAGSVLDAASSTAADVSKSAASAYDAAASNVGDAFTAATTSAGNVFNAASSSIASVLPTSIAGEEAVRSIVGMAQEQYASVSASASSIASSASISSVAGGVADTASKGVDQGLGSAQGLYESVKNAVESAGEAIESASESAKEAVVGVVDGEDAKLVGKQPEDKDFNTVGKAADALKEKIVHAEL